MPPRTTHKPRRQVGRRPVDPTALLAFKLRLKARDLRADAAAITRAANELTRRRS